MHDIPLSHYGRSSVVPAPVNQMMADFADDFRSGIDINLGVGYVNENTIPAEMIHHAFRRVIENPKKYPNALNYGGPGGSANLIESVKNFHLKNKIGHLTPDILDRIEFIVGPSGTTSLLESIAQLIPAGIVLTADPIYYIYCHFLERMGFRVVAVPEDDQGIDTQKLREKIDQLGPDSDHIRFIYVVTVNNPTATILSNARRKQLVRIAADLSRRLDRKVPLFLDKAYETLIHDPKVEKPESAHLYDDLGIVYELATLSKVLAPALRIGTLSGPPSAFLKAVVQRTADIGFSAPLINQEIAAYFLDHHIDDQLTRVNRVYRQKALQVKEWIDQYLAPCLLECRGGSAGFYYYLTFKNIPTHPDSHLFKFLTRTTGDPAIDGPPDNKNPRVIYIPGTHCVHPKGDLTQVGKRQCRISYGFEALDRIEQALVLFRQAIDSIKC